VTEDLEKIYELAKPILAVPCWAIYGDYDGEAPDTDHLVLCASEELARVVCDLLAKHIDKENHGEIPWRHDRWEGLSLPYVDGWQYVRSWKICETLCSPRTAETSVCKTVTAVLEALGGTPICDDNSDPEDHSDDCEECGAPPGQCDPRCGQDDRLD